MKGAIEDTRRIDRPIDRPNAVPEWPPVNRPADASDASFVPRTLREVEARHIAEVLQATRGRIGEAAKLLGVHRNTLTRKIREYGL